MNDDKTSAKIEAARAKAGGEMWRCPTCGNSPHTPFRRYDAFGRVYHGCIDASHAGKFTTGSESGRWHYRPTAVAQRRQTAKDLGLVRA